MQIAKLPAPSHTARPWLTSIEPWQREAVLNMRQAYGIDSDALVRAGLTLVLGIIAAAVSQNAMPDARRDGNTISDVAVHI